MQKYAIALSFFILCFSFGQAQNVEYAQKVIDELASEHYFGRGYVKNGDRKAAEYILNEMSRIGLQDINRKSSHSFSLNVNTFPGVMLISVDKEELTPGKDYVVAPSCPSIKLNCSKLFYVSESMLVDNQQFHSLLGKNYKKTVLLLDTVSNDSVSSARRQQFKDKFNGKCLIDVQRKLTWSVGREQAKKAIIWMKPGIIQPQASVIQIEIEAKFIEGYETKNVLGMIEGSEHPDSFIVVTGHYDHLGGLGENTYIPGANDNASGIAMILDLAKHYALNPPKYSVLFICFAAEEAGLVGSYFFVKDIESYLPKNNIRFLINMDLMGSGEEGIMAVNGKIFKEEFELLSAINNQNSYLTQVKSRGKAANSDHYFFTEAGVRGFFFYLMGAYAFYHEVDDSSDHLRLSKASYDNSFSLIRDFADSLMN